MTLRRLDDFKNEDLKLDTALTREWIVTNGLGGYSSGTVIGAVTRRYHGLLVAALGTPRGRTMMLNHLSEIVRLPDGSTARLSAEERHGALEWHGAGHLVEFRLELGLPVWLYEIGDHRVEKRVVMTHRQNTVHVLYRLVAGHGPVRLKLRPAVHFRGHDEPVTTTLGPSPCLTARDERYEIDAGGDFPKLRLRLCGPHAAFTIEPRRIDDVVFRVEGARGYAAVGALYSPGYLRVNLSREQSVGLVASTEPWPVVEALSSEEANAAEVERRRRLLSLAPPRARQGPAAELVLAADQFLILPTGRVEDAARAQAGGDELRSVIAGYHWFTDWGRDTMISLEGLTLCTGRHDEARWILHTFAHAVRDGLIPNLFPEGGDAGLYHTADATLWMFHAVDRYVGATGDRTTLRRLLPTLEEIVEHHRRGTRFGIGVDPKDGLLRQGEPGYQLTWMDAKCDGWVVTPRRGKAVEINALWYNALKVMERFAREERGDDAAGSYAADAERARRSFHERFWYEKGGWLYDVVDGEGGDDPALRPNQIFAVSLPNPILDERRWRAVVDVVERELLTPVGLRSLARGHPDYKRNYHGDLRTRDAAYHQGTVWSWLLGPFVDARLKARPDDVEGARRATAGLVEHLGEAGIGTISEVFDAEPPYAPRACIAQAWGVAELLRVLLRLSA